MSNLGKMLDKPSQRIADMISRRVCREQVVHTDGGYTSVKTVTYTALGNAEERDDKGRFRYYTREGNLTDVFLYVESARRETTIGYFSPSTPHDVQRSHFVPVNQGRIMICDLPRDDIAAWCGKDAQQWANTSIARNNRVLDESVSGPYAVKPAPGRFGKLLGRILG